MNEHFMKQAEDMMQAAKQVRMPENFQALAEESVARTRDAYTKLNAVAKEANSATEELVTKAAVGVRSLSEQAMANMSANTEAAFDAAEALARARSLPEAARLQADFMQQQFAVLGEQTRSFFEMSSKVMRETVEHANSVTARTMEQVRETGN
ncbi:MAG: phasin [Rhizobiales bacterium]|nr:phasin [Hyphomicrobiales bacterium]